MKASHLSDDRLIELCVIDEASATEQQHLSACARCDARRGRPAAAARRGVGHGDRGG